MSRPRRATPWVPGDERHLERAFELAERGRYGVSPNPMVGAVVVRGREGDRRRRPPPGGRSPRGGLGAAPVGRTRPRRRALPDARAVRAPGPHAAVRSRGHRVRRVARGRRGAGPEPARRGPRHRGAAAGGHRRRPGARALAPAGGGAEREILRLDHARPAVRPRQVGRDAGRHVSRRRPERAGGSRDPRPGAGRSRSARSTTPCWRARAPSRPTIRG